MFEEAIADKTAITELTEKRLAVALSDLAAFLRCITDETCFDECGAVHLTDDRGILVFLKSDSDRLLYSLTVDEFLQAYAGKVEWTRLLGHIGEWVRDAIEHYTRVRKLPIQTFSFESSEAQGVVEELSRLKNSR